jgi:hypothetical protein
MATRLAYASARSDEDKSLAEGHKPGELAYIEPYDPERDTGLHAVPKTALPNPTTSQPTKQSRPELERRREHDYITSDIGGGIHAIFGGTGLQPFGRTWDPSAKKAKPASHLDMENWMYEYAKSVSEANKELAVIRRSNIGQVQVGVGIVEREEDMWTEVEEEVEENEEGEDVDMREPKAETMDSLPTTKRKRKIKVYNPLRGVYDAETNVPHVYRSTQPTRCEIELIDKVPHISGDEELLDEGADELAVKERKAKRRRLALRAAKTGLASIEYALDPESYGWSNSEPLMPGLWDFRAGHFEPGEVDDVVV